jgi:alkanesulfonate monooxygenase SsuD/methylene tetrahydromethanopterin reductase-like flavin-dependent oxidoreductase (luciferase family)
MEFGVFDHLDRYDGALADYYEDRLKIAEAYDRAGFHAYHVAEHHSTPLGMAPSPSVFLARGGCGSGRWFGRCRFTIPCG